MIAISLLMVHPLERDDPFARRIQVRHCEGGVSESLTDRPRYRIMHAGLGPANSTVGGLVPVLGLTPQASAMTPPFGGSSTFPDSLLTLCKIWQHPTVGPGIVRWRHA